MNLAQRRASQRIDRRNEVQVVTVLKAAGLSRMIHTGANSNGEVIKAMQQVRFLFGKETAHLRVQERAYVVPAFSIAVAAGPATLCLGGSTSGLQAVDAYAADFGHLCSEIEELHEAQTSLRFIPDPIRIVEATPVVIDTLTLLARSTPHAFFRFVYAYCLALDRRYFSALARHAAAGDTQFLQFMDENCLNPWSVERYALEIGLPLRKFNGLFQEKYGVSAKRWLLERRLAHACELLRTTPLRVLDVAMACGFSNHAHFTDTFRKRFLSNPTQYRTQQNRNFAIGANVE
jgi:AraC-like DNA-binding protein